MMKKAIWIAVILLLTCGLSFAQTEEVKAGQPKAADTQKAAEKPQGINLGKINFPLPFIHSGKDYAAGKYQVIVTEKEGVYNFDLYDAKKVLLLSELAAVKPYQTKGRKFSHRLHTGLLKDNEFFRIKVIQPQQILLAYFKIKK